MPTIIETKPKLTQSSYGHAHLSTMFNLKSMLLTKVPKPAISINDITKVAVIDHKNNLTELALYGFNASSPAASKKSHNNMENEASIGMKNNALKKLNNKTESPAFENKNSFSVTNPLITVLFKDIENNFMFPIFSEGKEVLSIIQATILLTREGSQT